MNQRRTAKKSAPKRRAAPRARRVLGKKSTKKEPARPRKKARKEDKRAPKPTAAAKRLSLAKWLPNTLGRSTTDAGGVLLAVVKKSDGRVQQHIVVLDRNEAASEKTRRKEGAKILKEPAAAARLLHGAAHAERLRLMAELLSGPRTHHDLKTATGLKAGPLYHHIRELERADLVVTPARNRYELTEVGRLAFLLVAGLSALSSKGKRTAPWRTQRGTLKRG